MRHTLALHPALTPSREAGEGSRKVHSAPNHTGLLQAISSSCWITRT
jgi:hypothetical protein